MNKRNYKGKTGKRKGTNVHCKRCGSRMRKVGKSFFSDLAYWQCIRFPKDNTHRKPAYHTSDMAIGTGR